MQRLLQCMAVPEAAEAAAGAFRNLCVRCTSKLRDSHMLSALIDAVKGVLTQGVPPSLAFILLAGRGCRCSETALASCGSHGVLKGDHTVLLC